MINGLSYKEFYYVFNFDFSKKVKDALKMIHGLSPMIEQERMNIQIQEVGMPNKYGNYSHR